MDDWQDLLRLFLAAVCEVRSSHRREPQRVRQARPQLSPARVRRGRGRPARRHGQGGARPSPLLVHRYIMNRCSRKSQVRKCWGFCTADFWSTLVYKSAVQKTQTLPILRLLTTSANEFLSKERSCIATSRTRFPLSLFPPSLASPASWFPSWVNKVLIQGVPSARGLGLGWHRFGMFFHLAQLFSHFCQNPIRLGWVGQMAELPRSKSDQSRSTSWWNSLYVLYNIWPLHSLTPLVPVVMQTLLWQYK